MNLKDYVQENQKVIQLVKDKVPGDSAVDMYYGTLDYATARFHTILLKLSQDVLKEQEHTTEVYDCFVAIQDFYKNVGKPVPWNYWQIRDSRTLFSMMPYDPRKDIQEDLHNALADCFYQAKCVQKSFKHFGVKK